MPTRPHVLIAGGGVGAIEAALALRDLAGDGPHIELIAPDLSFVYRAVSVAEPFGYARHLEVPLARLRHTHGIAHRRDALAAVHPGTREVELAGGTRLHYDALVLALGARPEAWRQGAVTFTGPAAVPAVRAVLDGIAAGAVASVAFAAPTDGWTLPAYELALLTASWCADRHVPGVELTVTTPEAEPLERFGRAASEAVAQLLRDRGIAFASGGEPDADAVIALPRLRRSPLPGVPSGADGFIAVDEHSAVPGLRDVYAVGDCTDQPVKQGGLATQQADAAAAAIASRLGAPVEPEAFRPVLRGLLLTGVASAFLREDAAAFDALWWPPTKVAGRYLGPYLSRTAGGDGETLVDRPPPADAERAARDRAEVRAMAASLARAEARWGDHRSALHWLEAVERLDGVLDHDLAALRQECRVAAGQP